MSTLRIWCLVLGAALIVSSFAECQLISIPLKRMRSPREKMAEVGVEVDQLLEFESLRRYKPKPKPKPTNDSVALFKYLDSEFYADIQIGHPGQRFKMILDTAWSNTWVPSSKCSYLELACLLHNKYNSKESTSYFKNGTIFNVNIGSSNLTGFLSTDKFNLGHTNVANQTFAELKNIPLMYAFSEADGVIGLGYDTYSVDHVRPLFYNLVKQYPQMRPIFSFYINRDRTTDRGGNMIIGGSESKHYNGSFTYLPVTRKAYWQFHMDRIEFNLGTQLVPFCQKGCEAIIDTGTVVISGPNEDIKNIHDLFPSFEFFMGRRRVPCNLVHKLPSVNFVLAGKNFTIKGDDYVQEITKYGFTVCLSAFVENDETNFWTLGAAFLTEYYTEFDLQKDRVGFVKANL